MEMTITEALVQLKTLDKKINKGLENNVWATAGRKKSDEIRGIRKSDIEETIKANWQSINDLIENRKAIKAAVVKSNAVTEVTVGKHKMTVAEAIERKNNIIYEKQLLSDLTRALDSAQNAVETNNNALQVTIDNMLSRIADSEKQNMAAEQKALSESYLNENEWGLVDPLNLANVIEKMEKEIDDFESNVDTALSLSNAITKIEL